MSANPDPVIFDVRPLIARGIEPFSEIIEAKGRLKSGQRFVLRAPFEPVPLYSIFQNDGYQIDVRKHTQDDWEIVFIPSFGGKSEGQERDFRSLEPSSYLADAIEEVQALGPDGRLLLHTRSRPAELFEQLEAETIDFDCEEIGPNHWITTLWRVAR